VEKACFRASDIVFVCSNEDGKLARQLAPNAQVFIAPNGVDTSYFQPGSTQLSAKPVLLFTGNMSYEPNADAVEYFLDRIFPLIIGRNPCVEFVVAGRDADIYASRYAPSRPNVRFVANPPDMRPFFNQAWVCVVPLRSGGGTRLKILEAMAMRKAVVSTSVGAEGVPYRAGEDILICDDPREFAEAVLKLIDRPGLRESVADRGYEFARRNYDWTQITENAVKVVLGGLRNKTSERQAPHDL
jgi:glycosyltransferase involved in cell wall biosynthesis